MDERATRLRCRVEDRRLLAHVDGGIRREVSCAPCRASPRHRFPRCLGAARWWGISQFGASHWTAPVDIDGASVIFEASACEPSTQVRVSGSRSSCSLEHGNRTCRQNGSSSSSTTGYPALSGFGTPSPALTCNGNRAGEQAFVAQRLPLLLGMPSPAAIVKLRRLHRFSSATSSGGIGRHDLLGLASGRTWLAAWSRMLGAYSGFALNRLQRWPTIF